MIKHKLFWNFVSHDNEHEVTYWKEFGLPFVLGVGQSVRVLDCSPIDVASVEIDLQQDGLVDVNLKEWRAGNEQDEWSELHARFLADGWTWLDGYGMGKRVDS